MEKDQRILGLVDAENIYYSPKKLGGPKAKVDFEKLHNLITGGNKNAKVIFYMVADPLINQDSFIKRLKDFGYIPRVKVVYSEKGRFRNSNWDDEIIKEGIELIDEVDKLVLVSGDGDFLPLVDAYLMKRKNVSVICFEDNFSPSLKVVNQITFLDKSILLTPGFNNINTSQKQPECRFPMQSIFLNAS